MPAATEPAAAGTAPDRSPDWYQSATRWSQLTLVENDPKTFDLAFWLDVFERTESNAACLSAGGYIAFYPSKVPFHYVSRDLGGTDPFGDLVAGCRRLGMHVMARVDPHAIHADAAEAHPEWVQRLADGSPRRHWAFPEVFVTCALGPYNHEFMPQVIAEITQRYDIDAIFANRWSGHGTCWCESCKQGFKARGGHDIPLKPDVADPVWQDYLTWRREVLTSLIGQWNDVVVAHRPHARFIPNLGTESLLDFDLGVVKQWSPIMFCDHQGRHGVMPPWSAGRSAKRMRGLIGDQRPIGLITSVGPEEAHRWKDAVQSPPEIRLWITEGSAQGMRPWYTKFNASAPDRRWVAPVVEAFQEHARLEPALKGTEVTAEVALLDPTTTLRSYERGGRAALELHDQGVYQALVEARIPFELVSDLRLDEPAVLDRFKVIVAPNAAFLSDAQCDGLRRWVGRGGSLVAAFETSLYTEKGQRRSELGLADLFGVRLAGPARGPLKNTYIAFTKPGHPLTAGFGDTSQIMGGTRHLDIRVVEGAGTTVPMRFIPDFPDLPMEEVYARLAPRDPALVLRQVPGGGRVAYLPWNIGEIFWECLHPDHSRAIVDTIRWARGGRAAVEVQGPGVLDLAVHRGPGKVAAYLVNITNPMMMKGPLREVIPIGAQTVSLALSDDITQPVVRLLVAGTTPRVWREGQRLLVEVPGIATAEVVLVEQA